MATARTDKPYIWVTWLAKLLGGDLECEWAAWFKAHYKYDKFEEMAGDLTKWNADHSHLMKKKAAALEKLGYRVTTEKENEFKLEGTSAVIAGKPDLVAYWSGTDEVPAHTIAIDGKTGRRKHGDWWQVIIYLYALPLHWRRLKTEPIGELSGELFYATGADREQIIEPTELTPARKEDLIQLITLIAGATPPKKKPSREECRRCNIGPLDCAERVMGKRMTTTKTEDF